MRIALTYRFESDLRPLGRAERAAVTSTISGLPAALRAPRLHARLGLREIHSSGVWVARVGFGLRLVFALTGSEAVLLGVAAHEPTRRFLRRGR